jgi:hypothetical protein
MTNTLSSLPTSTTLGDRPGTRAAVVAMLQQKSPICLVIGGAIYAAGLAHTLRLIVQSLG